MRKRGCCGFPKKLPFGAKQRKGHVKWHLQPVLITTRSHQALSVVWRHHVALRRLWTRQLSQRPPKKAAQRHHRAPEQPRTPLTQPPARQRGAGSRLWPGAALLHALELVRRRAAPNAIAAAPHQAIPRRRRTAGADLAAIQRLRPRGPPPDRLDCAGRRPSARAWYGESGTRA